MLTLAWWQLPMQIAVGLLLSDIIRLVASFLLRAVSRS